MTRLLLACLLLTTCVSAQELFLRSYGTRDGLAHERVNAVLEAPGGHLWIATWEGLARFDGREFVSFGTESGLTPALCFGLALDPEGRLWTTPYRAGLARFVADADEGQTRFRTFAITADGAGDEVDALLFDERGMWVGTAAGVYRAREREQPEFELVWPAPSRPWHLQASFRAEGRGWIVTAEQALELSEEGVRVLAGPGGARPRDSVNAQATSDGRALIATDAGLFVFAAGAAARGAPAWTSVPHELAPDEVVHTTAIDARGRYLVGTTHGLLVLDGARTRRIGTTQGLPDEWLRTLYLDRAGSLWIGSNLGGLTCLREPELETFLGRAERARLNVALVLRSARGEILASTSDRGIQRLEAGGLVALEGAVSATFANVHVRLLQDRNRDWWLGTERGAWRVRGPELDLARAEPVPIAGGGGMLGEPFQDVDGRILMGSTENALCALDPSAEAPAFERWIEGRELGGVFPRAFLRDGAGVLWLATNLGLWRLHGSVPERVQPRGALTLAELEPRALLLDSRGTLWVGTRHAGAAFTRDPAAREPVFERLSLARGLPSEHVLALAEDGGGKIWLGTGRGLVRFDPESGVLRTYTSADGLAGEMVNDLALDADGSLWAACAGGLTRIDPRKEPRSSPPPPCHLRRFEAGGRALRFSAQELAHGFELELEPWQRAISATFEGIDLVNGSSLRFQHRLLGLASAWNEPTAESSVRYGSLAPGSYRLEVRAVTHDGVASAVPAVVAFHLSAPLWQRPWFVALLAGTLSGLAWNAWRVRRRRTRALAAIRTRIARDLHDEVGSNLAQIAVLAEVARREPPGPTDRLAEIAELARGTRSSMADLVWAIDPLRDTLLDLVQRMRAVTANLLDGGAIELELRVPPDEELDGLALAPDQRRHLLLFFKEALHNVERHAAARHVEVELACAPRRLTLCVRDDGRGFDPEKASTGQGLASLRARARELGATLRIESSPERGTSIELELAL